MVEWSLPCTALGSWVNGEISWWGVSAILYPLLSLCSLFRNVRCELIRDSSFFQNHTSSHCSALCHHVHHPQLIFSPFALETFRSCTEAVLHRLCSVCFSSSHTHTFFGEVWWGVCVRGKPHPLCKRTAFVWGCAWELLAWMCVPLSVFEYIYCMIYCRCAWDFVVVRE